MYRVVRSVPHITLFDTDGTRRYTAYQSGYGDRQEDIDPTADRRPDYDPYGI